MRQVNRWFSPFESGELRRAARKMQLKGRGTYAELVARGLSGEFGRFGEEFADEALRVVERTLRVEVRLLERVGTHDDRAVRPVGWKGTTRVEVGKSGTITCVE